MAIDSIKVDKTQSAATEAARLIAYRDACRRAYDLGKGVLGTMTHCQDGTTFTQLETLFGLTAGNGVTVFNLINGSVGSMEGTFQVADLKTLTEKLVG